MSYSFKRKDSSSYSNQEKLELAELVEKMKEEYDLKVEKTKGKQNMTTKENDMYLLNHPQGSLPKLYDNSMEISRVLKTMVLNLFAL